MKKRVNLILAFLLGASMHITAQIQHEEDGFVWEKVGSNGAKDAEGNLIIEPTKDGFDIQYKQAKSGSVTLGYFYVSRWAGSKSLEGIANTKGEMILPMKYAAVGMSVTMCGNDTLAYLYTANEDLSKKNIYDLSGKRFLKNLDNYDVDENGYFFNRETGKSYNVRIPKPGNLLANFYHRPPSETIKTSLGEFYATVQNSEGFSWKLLSLADGSICGAMNMDNKILVPVEDRAYELEYKDSLFFGRQEGAKGLAFVYAANGDVIIPRAENYNSISLDVGTESFFKATRFVENSTMDDVALYDLKGNLLIPIGKYYSIKPYKEPYYGNLYFEAHRKDDAIDILDHNLSPLITIHDENVFSVKLVKDRLGTYYLISKSMNGKQYDGIISENGTVIIPPNKYDIIKRETSNNFAYYETVIIKGEKYSEQQFLHGICDLSGKELVEANYDYIRSAGKKIELEKDGKIYTPNIDVSRPTRFPYEQTGGLYYLLNSSKQRINPIGYQKLTYDEERFCYYASIDGFTTALSPSGSETEPILNQMFSKASQLLGTNGNEAIRLLSRIIELDTQDYFVGLKSQACNNIGYVYQRQGDKGKAIEYYKKAIAYAPTNQIAENNLNNLLYPAPKQEVADKRTSEWDIAINILGVFNNSFNQIRNIQSSRQQTSATYAESPSTQRMASSRNDGKKAIDAVNENRARNNYWGYAAILDDMKNGNQPYNDRERQRIQEKMASLRQQYGFRMAEQETWSGF